MKQRVFGIFSILVKGDKGLNECITHRVMCLSAAGNNGFVLSDCLFSVVTSR